jgi:hypothetical protein
MPLPRDPRLPGKDATQHAAVENQSEHRHKNPETGPLEDSPGEEKSEVTENEKARAEVVGRFRAKRPQHHPADGDDENGSPDENTSAADEDNSSENEKRQSIGNQVAKPEMEKRSRHDPGETGNASRLDPESIEKPEEKGISDFQPPGDRNNSKEKEKVILNRTDQLLAAMVRGKGRRRCHCVAL